MDFNSNVYVSFYNINGLIHTIYAIHNIDKGIIHDDNVSSLNYCWIKVNYGIKTWQREHNNLF